LFFKNFKKSNFKKSWILRSQKRRFLKITKYMIFWLKKIY
jgi:hypothetical protein